MNLRSALTVIVVVEFALLTAVEAQPMIAGQPENVRIPAHGSSSTSSPVSSSTWTNPHIEGRRYARHTGFY